MGLLAFLNKRSHNSGKLVGSRRAFHWRSVSSCVEKKTEEARISDYLKSPDKFPLEPEKLGVVPPELNHYFGQHSESGSLSGLAKKQKLSAYVHRGFQLTFNTVYEHKEADKELTDYFTQRS